MLSIILAIYPAATRKWSCQIGSATDNLSIRRYACPFITTRRRILRATMTRFQSRQQSARFGGLSKPGCLVARRMLTYLVFAAALLQFLPVEVTSSRLAADFHSATAGHESLSADAHVLDCWAVQPSALTRVSGEKSSEFEPLCDGLTAFLSTVAGLSHRNDWNANFNGVSYRRCLVTLVNLNVRLQV